MNRRIKNAAIITLRGFFNCGNLLQNYALDKILKEYVENVVTLDIFHPIVKKKGARLNKIIRNIKLVFFPLFNRLFKNLPVKILLSKKRRVVLTNYITCETHKEILEKIIK